MAYTLATIVQIDAPSGDDRVRIVVEFTGAGEVAKRLERYVTGGDTNLTLRAWAREQALLLDGRKSIVDSLTVGQSVNLVPPAPPTPTAKEVWQEKAARLARLRGLGTVSASALLTAITALADDVRTSFAAGFLDDF